MTRSTREEQFVWMQWRRVWYMGRVVEQQTESSSAAARVKVHIHGELDTSDKWLASDSANLVLVAVVPSELTAVGAFPALHDGVELLQMDAALHELLLRTAGDSSDVSLLTGRVAQVLPAHDASVVDVLYPPAYHHVARERRVHIGNGYLRVISEGTRAPEAPLAPSRQPLDAVAHTVYSPSP